MSASWSWTIMVTGNTNPGDVAAAKKASVNGYVVKPYNLATLKQRLEATLGPLDGARRPVWMSSPGA